MFLRIKTKPGSRANQISSANDGTTVVKVKAPAQGGKANEELIRFLSETLNLPKSKIQIVSGFTSPFKKIEIDADENAVRTKLGL